MKDCAEKIRKLLPHKGKADLREYLYKYSSSEGGR